MGIVIGGWIGTFYWRKTRPEKEASVLEAVRAIASGEKMNFF